MRQINQFIILFFPPPCYSEKNCSTYQNNLQCNVFGSRMKFLELTLWFGQLCRYRVICLGKQNSWSVNKVFMLGLVLEWFNISIQFTTISNLCDVILVRITVTSHQLITSPVPVKKVHKLLLFPKSKLLV